MNAIFEDNASTFFASYDTETRKTVRAHLIAMGATDASASLIMDVAIHAKNKAIDILAETASTIDGNDMLSTFLTALELTRIDCGRLHNFGVAQAQKNGAVLAHTVGRV